MADYTLAADDRGVYEIAIAAYTPVTFAVGSDPLFGRNVRIHVHSSVAPVYVKRGATVEPQERAADMIPDLSYYDLVVGGDDVFAVASAQPAVISVTRS